MLQTVEDSHPFVVVSEAGKSSVVYDVSVFKGGTKMTTAEGSAMSKDRAVKLVKLGYAAEITEEAPATPA